MSNHNIKNIIISLLLVFSGILLYSSDITSNKQKSEHVMTLKDYLVGTFISELPEINKNLPHRIDDSTILLSIEYIDGKIISRYKLLSLPKDYPLINSVDDKFKDALKRQVCSQEIKRKLLEVDAEFVEIYQSPEGLKAFEVTVKKIDCIDSNNRNLK